MGEFTPSLIDVGPCWMVAQLQSAQAVLSCQPDLIRMKAQDAQAKATGVVIFGAHSTQQVARIEVRAFAPAHGVNEDPVCGSGNGCVAAFIRNSGQNIRFGNDFLSSQGAAVGRAGMIRLSISPQRIQIGGAAVTCIDGHISVSTS
jgi:PhzF family phenazine biosynthesis protein